MVNFISCAEQFSIALKENHSDVMGLFGWISSYCRIKLNASLPLHIPFLPHALLRLILPQFGKMTSVYAGYYHDLDNQPCCQLALQYFLIVYQLYKFIYLQPDRPFIVL